MALRYVVESATTMTGISVARKARCAMTRDRSWPDRNWLTACSNMTAAMTTTPSSCRLRVLYVLAAAVPSASWAFVLMAFVEDVATIGRVLTVTKSTPRSCAGRSRWSAGGHRSSVFGRDFKPVREPRLPSTSLPKAKAASRRAPPSRRFRPQSGRKDCCARPVMRLTCATPKPPRESKAGGRLRSPHVAPESSPNDNTARAPFARRNDSDAGCARRVVYGYGDRGSRRAPGFADADGRAPTYPGGFQHSGSPSPLSEHELGEGRHSR